MPEFKNILLVTITGIGLYVGYVYYNKNNKQSIAPPDENHPPPKDPLFIKTETTLGTAPKSTTTPVSTAPNVGNLLIKAFSNTTTSATTTPVNNTLQKKLIDDFLKGTLSNNSVIPNKLPQPVDNFFKIGSTAPITTLSSVQAPPMPVSVNKINLVGFPFKSK